jgi:hypothetical protein
MSETAQDSTKRQIEDEANKLFPGAIRRIEWQQYGDAPWLEPGELMPSLVLPEPPGARKRGRPEPRQALHAFQKSHGPALKQFQHELARRWPRIRHIGIGFEDASGRPRGGIVQALDGQPELPGSEFTHVMVRLKEAELEIVDTLITAGIANSRAEAIRWALTRIGERPAYAQLREHTRDIERLKNEF